LQVIGDDRRHVRHVAGNGSHWRVLPEVAALRQDVPVHLFDDGFVERLPGVEEPLADQQDANCPVSCVVKALPGGWRVRYTTAASRTAKPAERSVNSRIRR
jgi:hypothetical protein